MIDQEYDFSQQKISKYNSAELQNLILHGLWKQTHNYCQAGLYEKWNAVLDLIWGELAGDEKEESDAEKKYNDFAKDLANTGKLNNPAIEGFNNMEKSKETKSKQYEILLKKQIWLKRLQNTQGKGTAYKSMEDDWE